MTCGREGLSPVRAGARLALPLLVIVLACGCRNAANPAVQTDIVYGTVDGVQLKLDAYPSTTPGVHPACLLIHGGGWGAGSKADLRKTGLALARAGIVCFAVDYRLAPKFRHPAQIEDCARAVRWLRTHAGQWGADPQRLAAWGESAGGHLALMLATMERGGYQSDEDPDRGLSAKVNCVVSFFGPADLRGESGSMGARFYVTRFIGAPPGAAAEEYADASPVTHVTAAASPVLMVHGDRDQLVPLQQSEAMKAALDAAGVENELIVVKQASHNLKGASPADRDAAYERAQQWLLAHLQQQAD